MGREDSRIRGRGRVGKSRWSILPPAHLLKKPDSHLHAYEHGFGVSPSYLLARGKDLSVLDEEVLKALADKRARSILRESTRLPEREKEIVLGIGRQFGSQIDDA